MCGHPGTFLLLSKSKVKYGLAILWDGPCEQELLDAGYATAVYDCVLIKLAEINRSMAKNGLPVVDYTVVARDQTDCKGGANPKKG